MVKKSNALLEKCSETQPHSLSAMLLTFSEAPLLLLLLLLLLVLLLLLLLLLLLRAGIRIVSKEDIPLSAILKRLIANSIPIPKH